MIAPQGKADVLKIQPLARMGRYDYAFVQSAFEIKIGGGNNTLLSGLEGAAGHLNKKDFAA